MEEPSPPPEEPPLPVEVSLIVKESFATSVVLAESVYKRIVSVSGPSVVESAVGVIVNDPAFELIDTDP
jgi:hypothetical protein